MRFKPESLVAVHVSVRQRDGAETVVGRSDTGVFLVVPAEAETILDQLAAGKTVAEAQTAFLEQHGELPDMEEFLSLLERKGLVELSVPGSTPAPGPAPLHFHFANFPEALARRLFGAVPVLLSLVLISGALAALAIDLGVLPGWRALYFRQNLTAMTVVLFGFYYASLWVHEMAHLVAARAVGVASRLRLGHRLWILVAETDMSGLWAVPRSRRYLPLLAGPLVDATSASLLVFVLFGSRHGWWSLSSFVDGLLRAFLLIYLLNLLWQCCLFLRTDLYYVLTNYLGCKNLLGDTEAWLRAQLSRHLPFLAARDAPQIPERELRAVKVYTGVWFFGRVVALAALVFIYVPLAFRYVITLVGTLAGGFHAHRYEFFDALVTTTLVLGPMAAGSWLWLRSLDWTGRRHSVKAY
jgi:putative peptide zinc metalloprotease protein